MSYSFTVRAADKATAKRAVAAEFDKIVASQPHHSLDRAAALACADLFVDLLPVDPTKNVQVSMFGSIGLASVRADPELMSAGVGVTALLTHKAAG